ncbi:hypothetical protein [Undibacterium sp. TJN19]|uniref:hypothetical protein n=1 Tax=Undibacterium sp. TJN19 TaxID=3413055 RepID=UPI003BF2809E
MNSSTRQIVFIDGVGGKRYMRSKFVRYFEKRGYIVECFDYKVSSQSFDEIKKNLSDFLTNVGNDGDYHAVGYSFGGVLLRTVNNELAPRLRPKRVVLLASPVRAMKLAHRLRDWKIYQMLTGECGQFAGNDERMSKVPLPNSPSISIYGTWPWLGVFGFFFGFTCAHDGMVAANEAMPSSQEYARPVSASHAFIPSNEHALQAIEQWFGIV